MGGRLLPRIATAAARPLTGKLTGKLPRRPAAQPAEMKRTLNGANASAPLFARLADALQSDWSVRARPDQLPPPGNWTTWLMLGGRGSGKTRSGSEWVRTLVETGAARRIALVAPTAADARDVMVEGESGILATAPSWCRPQYEPSKRRLTWPNGAIATCFSADEPERLRGPQHDAAWCDELGAWRYAEAWDMLQFGLRLGANPRVAVTTTPRPTKLLRTLIAGKDVAISRSRTAENAANLAPQFLATIVSKYQGTRLGRQELDAELLEDTPGALWSHDMIERGRVSSPPILTRIVVSIDPAGSSGEGSDETGIIVAGTDGKGHGYILDDLSGRYAPTTWARRSIAAYKSRQADRIVAEKNYGGEMVEATIRAVDASVAFKAVTSSRGKVLRAEPVSALYEQGRVHHVGCFAELEDQQCGFTSDFDRARAGYSPDRVDALVFALTELLVGESCDGWMEAWEQQAAIARGERPRPALPKHPEQFNALGELLTGSTKPSAARPAATVALRAPREFMRYAPAKGVLYESGAEGLIEAAPEHVNALLVAGCTRAQE